MTLLRITSTGIDWMQELTCAARFCDGTVVDLLRAEIVPLVRDSSTNSAVELTPVVLSRCSLKGASTLA
jgi:hypothetical protein